jgi:AMMECR1 domain-containing protein
VKEHCKLCFDTLIAKLSNKQLPEWPEHLPKVSVPLFVTWKITANHELRGCIGTFSKQEIQKVLPKYALISALNDDRFDPV